MPVVNFFTYRDAVRHVLDYLGGDPEAQAKRDSRRAVRAAYREFSAAHRWTYYYQRGRVNINAAQTVGTIQYVSATRQLTITGNTWPSWVTAGTVVINNVSYEVDTSISSTVVTLSVNSCPQTDIASGTTYTLYQDTYTLPADFLQADTMVDVGNFFVPKYVNPRYWLDHQRLSKSPARPRFYTITSDPRKFGVMAVRLYPAPDAVYQYDFIYQRKPRELVVEDQHAGTVNIVGTSAVIAGTNTVFDTRWAGSVIRTSTSTTLLPEGQEWDNPFDQERVILSVASGTSLTVDSTYPTTYNGVTYVISDPVDVEHGAMLNCFLRCCEKQACYTRKTQPAATDRAEKAWINSLIACREADSRHFEEQTEGSASSWRQRLALMPRGPDIS